jgi:RNA polymerase sigma-70 factor (ECF subfamily)
VTPAAQLVRRIADPQLSAAERALAERDLCLQLAPRIRLYALRRLRDEAAAADLTQEVLIALLGGARENKISEPEHIERYVFGICRNLVLRVHRTRRHARAYEASVLPVQEHELPPAFAALDSNRVAWCLGKLGARDQRVVVLTFREEQSAEQIAQQLSTSPNNVRQLRHRAMLALQRCVQGHSVEGANA